MLRNAILVTVSACALAVPAAAQQIVIQPRAASMPESKGGDIRVNVGMSFLAPAQVNDPAAATKAQEHARRVLYESAGHECDVLQAVLASECRLESINVNVNRTFGNQQPEGFNANGNFVFHVKLK